MDRPPDIHVLEMGSYYSAGLTVALPRPNVYLGPMFKGFEFCLPARQDCPQAELKDLKAMARLKMDAQVIALALGRHVAASGPRDPDSTRS